MLQRLVYNVTYDITTPESAEQGEFEESGFEHEGYHAENVADVLYLIEQYGFSDLCQSGLGCAAYADHGCIDFRTGEEQITTVLPCNERSARYLERAYRLYRDGYQRSNFR